MAVWLATVWGLTGALCVEALELYAHIRRTSNWDWRCPVDQGMVPFVVTVVIRVGVGAALAAAFAGSNQVSGPLAAFTLGVASPMVVTRLASAIPLSGGPSDSDGSYTAAHPADAYADTHAVLAAPHGGDEHPPVAGDVAVGDSDAC